MTPPAPPSPPAEPSPSLREWAGRNGPSLMLLAALIVFLFAKFDASGLWSIAKAAIGLGLVIFIHELGHFAVAKWCDVHVETFSIGFGPALPGCKFKYGETTYMVALFPLGGYVKMVGEGAESEEGDDDPRSFKNKTVWQRMAIISAGVVMNVILAFVCFIVVFRGPGKKQDAAVVGKVDTGSPAWASGIPSGAWIRELDGIRDPYFADLLYVVMLSGQDEALDFVYTWPPYDTKPTDLKIVPETTGPRPLIGVSPSSRLVLALKRYYKERHHPVVLHSAAARATPPLEFEDAIVGVAEGDQRAVKWQAEWDLPADPRAVGPDQPKQPDYFAFARHLHDWAGKPITLRVRRKGDKEGSAPRDVTILVPPAYHFDFGVRMQMGEITAVRKDQFLDRLEAEQRPLPPDGDFRGDVIEQVEVRAADGKVTRFVFPSKKFQPDKADKSARAIDPTRLPFELRQWAARTRGGDRTVALRVRRHKRKAGDEEVVKTLTLKWDDRPRWTYASEVPYSQNSPLSIAELGIGYKVKSTVTGLDKNWPGHRQPLQDGDVIKKVRFWTVREKGNIEEGSPLELRKNDRTNNYDQWAFVFWNFQHYADVKKITAVVDRGGEEKEVVLKAEEDRTWPLVDRGLILMPDRRVQRADSIGAAVLMGLQDTSRKIVQVYMTLRGIIIGRISPKNLGGPITIGRVAFTIAGENFWEFVYFLGLISINLAVVNFLPIPVLDGGHMVFLIYEKIRGKPASEQVRSGATIVGLLLLASLMIFVLYLDVSRIVGK